MRLEPAMSSRSPTSVRPRHEWLGIVCRSSLFALATFGFAGCSGQDLEPGNHELSVGCAPILGETVRWIVPFSAGGGYDIYSRLLEPFYEETLGAEIVIENRVGADGLSGARALRDARPDGRTLGLLNGFSLFVGELISADSDLDPVEDFTLLGRLAPSFPVWVSRQGSGITSLDDLVALSLERPIVVGISGIGVGFVSVSLGAHLLGIDVAYVAGYPGTREASMGLIRGEIDIMGVTYESILDRVEDGYFTPILRISDEQDTSNPTLDRVPFLAGPQGLAVEAAAARGEDTNRALALSLALSQLFEVGRLVAGPPGLEPELARCLSGRLAEAARDPAFASAAAQSQRLIRFQEAERLTEDLQARADDREALGPILLHHVGLMRSGAPGF